MAEVSRNLMNKFNKTEAQASYREAEIKKAFPEAWVEGYEPFIDVMTNDRKDRHVLAVAVRSGSGVIVTYNKTDFPPAALKPWGIEVRGPSGFLRDLYDLEPGIVTHKITEQARTLDLPIERLLLRLRVNVPGFVDFFCRQIGIEFPLQSLPQGPS